MKEVFSLTEFQNVCHNEQAGSGWFSSSTSELNLFFEMPSGFKLGFIIIYYFQLTHCSLQGLLCDLG